MRLDVSQTVCVFRYRKGNVKLKGKLAELPARKIGPIQAIHQVYTDLRCPQFILNDVSSVYPKDLSPLHPNSNRWRAPVSAPEDRAILMMSIITPGSTSLGITLTIGPEMI